MKKRSKIADKGLQAIQTDVAGIDLGSREHYVCGPVRNDEKPNVQAFGTTTPDLKKLARWLKKQSVRSVTMEE